MTTALTKTNGHGEKKLHYWASAPVDVLEGGEEYLILADIPGVTKDKINISYADVEVKIQAIRDERAPVLEYRRSFTVGDNVDPDAVSAELEQGVLKVRLPKLEKAKTRTIPIRAA